MIWLRVCRTVIAFFRRGRAILKRDPKVAVIGFVLFLPALILVSTGLFDLERPDAVVHPILVMSGLFLAFALNAMAVLRINFGRESGKLVGTVAERIRGSAMNLMALAVSCLLLAAITAYLFVENFQPR